jgi:predicted nucleotidyltransferase component of viral defense system
MRLHEDSRLFRQAVLATAHEMQLPDVYVEKDYWVTLALKKIFSGAASTHCVFKGGTSLSKCYGLIDRFSEDVDLVVRQSGGDSGAQLKKKLKTVSESIVDVLPEVEVAGVTMKRGMIRKTAHSYPKLFEGRFGQVRGDVILLESSWLGESEPSASRPLSCYLYEMMLRNGQEQMVTEFELLPFDVQVLRPERTLCEKMMSLVRFSCGENPVESLKNKVRHIYDLYQLLEREEYDRFFESDEFEMLLKQIARSDLKTLSHSEWIRSHPADALVFAEAESVWQELEPVYSGAFRDLVYGTLPAPELMEATLCRIRDRMRAFSWIRGQK